MKKKDTYAVGLDIGTSAIKLIIVKSGPQGKELLAFFNQPLADTDFVTAIKNITASVPLETNRVNVSVSGPGVVTRCINIPKMNESELASAMRFEAEKHILFPLDQVIYDTQILKEDAQNNTMLILIAAAKKDTVASLTERLSQANLEPESITIDSLALTNAYLNSIDKAGGIICLLNIGAAFTNLVIVDSGLLKLSRDINFGAATITKKISEVLNISEPEAEELKCYAKTRQDELRVIYDPLLGGLASEIRDSFDYFETQNNATVGKIILSGGASKLNTLSSYLRSTLGAEVEESWDPFVNFKFNQALDMGLFKNQIQRFAVACGLVLND